jgi:hypothetical protein
LPGRQGIRLTPLSYVTIKPYPVFGEEVRGGGATSVLSWYFLEGSVQLRRFDAWACSS